MTELRKSKRELRLLRQKWNKHLGEHQTPQNKPAAKKSNLKMVQFASSRNLTHQYYKDK